MIVAYHAGAAETAQTYNRGFFIAPNDHSGRLTLRKSPLVVAVILLASVTVAAFLLPPKLNANKMQTQVKTAGETASTITLVAIIDCHASHNVRMNVKPEEKGYIKRFLKAHGYQVVERKPKPQEPTCDNCGNMAVRHTGSGNHRHCDLMNLYIPDNEMFPRCDYHTAVMKFQNRFSGKGRYENTMRKGGRQ